MIWKFDSVQDTSDVAVAYGKVFVSADNYLYCLDEEEGKVLWSYGAEFSWLSSVPSVADGKVLVPTYDKVLCVNAYGGSFLWDYSTTSSRALIVVAEDLVLFSTPKGIVAIGDKAPESTVNIGVIFVFTSLAVVAVVIVALVLKPRRKKTLRQLCMLLFCCGVFPFVAL